jgi:hypothetical protein
VLGQISSAGKSDPQSLARPLPPGGGNMTTEIAVSNQFGIALASDSAVTITGSGHVKVFNTADKLFELSAIYPVALMVNGNMACIGAPWEILIKDFRTKEESTPRGSIEKWARDFLVYIENHNPGAEEAENGHIDRCIVTEIQAVQELILQVVRRFVFEVSRGSDHILTKRDLDVSKALAAAVELRKETITKSEIAASLASLSHDAILANTATG